MKFRIFDFRVAVASAVFAASTANAAPSLNDLICLALSNNPALRSADCKVASAKAQAGQAKSAWLPQVKTSAQYARTDNPPQAFFMELNQRRASLQNDFNNPGDVENMRLSASAGWLLFDGGQRNAMVKMAELGTVAQRLAKAAAVNNLVHDVTHGFYGALQARDAVEVAASAVKSIEESLRLAQTRVNAGAAMKSDALNLEVKLAEAKQRQIQARNGFAFAIASLNTEIGKDAVSADALKSVTDVTPLATSSDSSIEQRPELQAAQKLVQIKKEALQKARRAYSPTLSAFGSVDWDSDVSSDFQRSYMAGAAVEVELFDGGRRSKGVAQAYADCQAAQADAELSQRQLQLDLTQAKLQLDDASSRREVASAATASAEEALRLTRERYQQGAADISELLNAETAQTASRSNASSAEYEVLIAQSNLARAQGAYAARYENSVKE